MQGTRRRRPGKTPGTQTRSSALSLQDLSRAPLKRLNSQPPVFKVPSYLIPRQESVEIDVTGGVSSVQPDSEVMQCGSKRSRKGTKKSSRFRDTRARKPRNLNVNHAMRRQGFHIKTKDFRSQREGGEHTCWIRIFTRHQNYFDFQVIDRTIAHNYGDGLNFHRRDFEVLLKSFEKNAELLEDFECVSIDKIRTREAIDPISSEHAIVDGKLICVTLHARSESPYRGCELRLYLGLVGNVMGHDGQPIHHKEVVGFGVSGQKDYGSENNWYHIFNRHVPLAVKRGSDLFISGRSIKKSKLQISKDGLQSTDDNTWVVPDPLGRSLTWVVEQTNGTTFVISQINERKRRLYQVSEVSVHYPVVDTGGTTGLIARITRHDFLLPISVDAETGTLTLSYVESEQQGVDTAFVYEQNKLFVQHKDGSRFVYWLSAPNRVSSLPVSQSEFDLYQKISRDSVIQRSLMSQNHKGISCYDPDEYLLSIKSPEHGVDLWVKVLCPDSPMEKKTILAVGHTLSDPYIRVSESDLKIFVNGIMVTLSMLQRQGDQVSYRYNVRDQSESLETMNHPVMIQSLATESINEISRWPSRLMSHNLAFPANKIEYLKLFKLGASEEGAYVRVRFSGDRLKHRFNWSGDDKAVAWEIELDMINNEQQVVPVVSETRDGENYVFIPRLVYNHVVGPNQYETKIYTHLKAKLSVLEDRFVLTCVVEGQVIRIAPSEWSEFDYEDEVFTSAIPFTLRVSVEETVVDHLVKSVTATRMEPLIGAESNSSLRSKVAGLINYPVAEKNEDKEPDEFEKLMDQGLAGQFNDFDINQLHGNHQFSPSPLYVRERFLIALIRAKKFVPYAIPVLDGEIYLNIKLSHDDPYLQVKTGSVLGRELWIKEIDNQGFKNVYAITTKDDLKALVVTTAYGVFVLTGEVTQNLDFARREVKRLRQQSEDEFMPAMYRHLEGGRHKVAGFPRNSYNAIYVLDQMGFDGAIIEQQVHFADPGGLGIDIYKLQNQYLVADFLGGFNSDTLSVKIYTHDHYTDGFDGHLKVALVQNPVMRSGNTSSARVARKTVYRSIRKHFQVIAVGLRGKVFFYIAVKKGQLFILRPDSPYMLDGNHTLDAPSFVRVSQLKKAAKDAMSEPDFVAYRHEEE